MPKNERRKAKMKSTEYMLTQTNLLQIFAEASLHKNLLVLQILSQENSYKEDNYISFLRPSKMLRKTW